MTETESKLRAAADAAPAAYLVGEPDEPPSAGALWNREPTAAELAGMAAIGRPPVVVTPLKPAVDDEIRAALAQLDAARAEAARLAGEQIPTVEDINAQAWAGLDASTALWLIERHAEDWQHAGRLLNAWRIANLQPQTAEAAGG